MTEQRLVDTYMDTKRMCWLKDTMCSETSAYLGCLGGSEARLTGGGGDSSVLRGHGCCGGAGRGHAHRVD